MKCSICKKIEVNIGNICIKCIEKIQYYIGGQKVSKELFYRITKRGYVIAEELDKDRK